MHGNNKESVKDSIKTIFKIEDIERNLSREMTFNHEEAKKNHYFEEEKSPNMRQKSVKFEGTSLTPN